ncbi:MAG: 50S ribosomal protein L24 [Rickettsiales bacterium]|nr:50S ribosomal protein L24 [Rickettsiales bacterium]|tara:strand:- start:182 stop:490 length:309 start_codon:yes stop_codon:yes gene_type:complete
MSKLKTHVKINDIVEVISGNNKGDTGKILQVLTKSEQVIIEGVRMIKKHAKKTQDRPDGGIVELEGPIHISNVKKIQSKANKAESNKKENETSQVSEDSENS